MTGVFSVAAAAIPPTQIVAVTRGGGGLPVLSWDFPTPGALYQITPPIGFRLYNGAATDSRGNLYVSRPRDFDFGADGNIYSSLSGEQPMYRVAPVTGATPDQAFLMQIINATAMKTGPDGRIYFASDRRIFSSTIDGSGGVSPFVEGPSENGFIHELTFGNVIPAPGTACVMGLAGAVALRRRRQ